MRALPRFVLFLYLILVLLACSGSSAPERGASMVPAAPSVQDLAWQKIRAGALLIDVRTPAEYAQGHLEEAINIPHDQIETRAAELGNDRSRQIVVYCRSGRRSGIASKTLERLGFTRVFDAGAYQSLLQNE